MVSIKSKYRIGDLVVYLSGVAILQGQPKHIKIGIIKTDGTCWGTLRNCYGIGHEIVHEIDVFLLVKEQVIPEILLRSKLI